jgi:serine/threonine protein phosphatase PrpC
MQEELTSATNGAAFGSAIVGERSDQQDNHRIRWLDSEKAWLLVLADGMGGHAAGEVASKLAVDGFVSAFAAARVAGEDLETSLRDGLEDANARIGRAASERPELYGLGTTISAAHLSSKGVTWISVGDSPIWLSRGKGLTRLNKDHSFRNAAVESAAGLGNLLQSALTGQPIPLVDCRAEPLPLQRGDLILVASDGILTLSDDEIVHALAKKQEPPAQTEALLQAVTDAAKPHQDNCTVIVASAPMPVPRVQPVAAHADRPVARLALGAAVGAAVLIVGYILLS